MPEYLYQKKKSHWNNNKINNQGHISVSLQIVVDLFYIIIIITDYYRLLLLSLLSLLLLLLPLLLINFLLAKLISAIW